jgi:hypothetical protein
MNKKSFALRIVTGIMALFGLNEAANAAPAALLKTAQPDRATVFQDLLPLNGELLTAQASPDVVSETEPAPAPEGLAYGVEATGGQVAARLQANALARQAILAPEPDLNVLRAYSGTGGLGDQSESIDQFYTPGEIGALMWTLACLGQKLDDPKKPVRALEPSCGNGGLLAQAPAGLHLTGVELDPVAGRAAQLLHPHAAVHIMAMESYTMRSSDPLFNLAVLNPPFGSRGETRDLHERDEVRSERYFMTQTLRRVMHGGTVVALLPLSVLHGQSHRDWRAALLRQALPLHAVVVPEGAFREAGAGVTTVLLVLRRHDVGVAEGCALHTDTQLTEMLLRHCPDMTHQTLVQGFIEGKGLVQSTETDGEWTHALTLNLQANHLGRVRADFTTGRFGQPALRGEVRADTSAVVTQLQVAQKSAPITLRSMTETIRSLHGDQAAQAFFEASEEAQLFPIAEGTLSTDRRYCFRLGAWQVTDDFADPRVFHAAELAQTLESYLHARTAGRVETPRRRALVQARFQAYVRQHGNFNRQRFLRLVDAYPLFSLLLSHINDSGELHLPSDADVRLPITGQGVEEVAGQLADLLALTEDTLSDYAGVSVEEAAVFLTEHYAFDGERWIEPGLYYAGHAILRSGEARDLARAFTGHRRETLLAQADEFMTRVRRTPVADLNLSPRDPVIPVAALEAWVNAYLNSAQNGKPLLNVERTRGAVKLSVRASAGDELVQARSAFDFDQSRALEAFLNHKTEVETIRGAKEMSKEEYTAARTLAIEDARQYEAQVTRHFQAWLPESAFAQLVEDAYTFARGATLRAQGSTRPLAIAGYQGKTPHPYQLMDVRTMAMTPGMVNNYDVGLGKTIEMLLLIGYLKMCGRASRPIISVPAGLVSNWATNAREAYPSWNIVTVGMSVRHDKKGQVVYKRKRDGSYMLKDGQRIEAWTKDTPAVKKTKIASLAAGTVDLIIMSREALTSLPMLRENRQRLIMDDPQYLRNLETQDAFEGQPRRGRHQELVRQLGVFGAMMSRVNVARPGDLCFEVLGCDFLGHDEAHGLKNLASPPAVFGETPRFLGAGGESQRSLDALHKGRYIRERGGSTFAFTASWVKNSPLEIGAMLSMVTDALPSYGLPTGEALMDQYLKIEPQIITGMDGSVDVKPCVTGFRRLRELRHIIANHVISRTYGDPEVVTGTGQPLAVPTAEVDEVMIDMSAEQAHLYTSLRERARNADARAKGPNHPFAIQWEMRKLSIDPVLLNVAGPNPRFERIAELALENRATGGKGLVFLSIGEKQGAFTRLKNTLVAAGYPAQEIAIVSSDTHKSSVERQDLEDDYNYGDLTLILGTDVLGQGFNLQVGTSLIINADMPWNFEEIRQRVGRGARQGNTVDKLRNVYLLMRGSFDTLTYTIMSGKKSWLSQLWDSEIDELGNSGQGFSGEEMALLMSDDVEATRAQILSKKTELAERTGRAALERQLESLAAALNARDVVQQRYEKGRRRKYGLTANDHVRVRVARGVFDQRVTALKQMGDFPLARLVDYTGEIFWFGLLPVHEGLGFKADDQRFTVRQVTTGVIMATSEKGESRTFTGSQLMRATDFTPNADARLYQAAAALEVPRIALSDALQVYVIDSRRAKKVCPRDPELVVSLSLSGQRVELVNPEDSFGLMSRLICKETVMHFQVQTVDGVQVVQQVIVLSAVDSVLDKTKQTQASPKLHARLLQLVARVLGAEVVEHVTSPAQAA